MTQPESVRRLAAVLAADVAHYSRMMGADEEATMDAWWAHRREVINPTIEGRRGRIVKLTGDGFLAEFPSVREAVLCAVEMQAEMAKRNASVPHDRRMDFRMGINLCDIIVDDEDIYGDGVNIAARLESLAHPGGITISGKVYEDIVGKLDLAFVDLGEKHVKNIERPVRAYHVVLDTNEIRQADATAEAAEVAPAPGGGDSPAAAPRTAAVKSPPSDKPSIAVLPFTNMSGDPEQEYFSDGISEDVTTDLSKISGLFVIARNTAFTYKGKNIDLQQVARELGVRYVLEGSVRKAGNRVRITAQLIDGTTNGHVWAERYDRDLEDIFGVQDEVTQEIVAQLKVQVSDAERQRMVKKDTENLDAYDDLLKGRDLFLKFTPECNREAEQMFKRAIESDPNYAAAYAELARVLVQRRNHGWSDTPDEDLEEGFRMVSKAVELDDSVAQAHIVKGFVHLWRHEHDQALAELDAGLGLDPNHADGHMWKAIVAGFAGDPEEGVREVQHAMRLNPGSPFWYLFALGNACFAMWRYEECVQACSQAVEKNPNFIFAQMLLAAGLGQLGRNDGADAALAECRRLNSRFSLAWAKNLIPFRERATIERFTAGLEKAGLTA